MSIVQRIISTYHSPKVTFYKILSNGVNEAGALATLMGACVLTYVAQWPYLARRAHLHDDDLQMLLGAGLLGWLFIAPLLMYLLALLFFYVHKFVGGKKTALEVRFIIFWSFLVTSPIMLLHGLIRGFIGPSLGLDVVGLIWLGAVLFFVLVAFGRPVQNLE